MSFHETEHGMTHEDIVPLVDRIASLLATERGLSRDRAATLAHKMLHEMAGDVDVAIGHFRAAAARTTSIPEQRYLTLQAARLGAGPAPRR